MIKHSKSIVKAVVQHLNPGQAPVLTADQPLFALAKQIQWTWPDTLGKNHFVVILGGLHIEMAILKVCECVCMHNLCNVMIYIFMYRYLEVGWMAVDGLMLLCRITLQALVQQI